MIPSKYMFRKLYSRPVPGGRPVPARRLRRPQLQVERLDERLLPTRVAAGFENLGGLWRWTESGGWSQLTTANPDEVDMDDDGNVVASFLGGAPAGLWRWTESGGWVQLSTFTIIEEVELSGSSTSSGHVVVADFGTANGLWRWTTSSGWQQLHTANFENVEVDDNGNVVVDYGSNGLWRWTEACQWKHLSTLDPFKGSATDAGQMVTLQVDDSGAVFSIFNDASLHLWRWIPQTACDAQNIWTDLTAALPDPRPSHFQVADTGVVYANFSSGASPGLSRWTLTGGWVNLTPYQSLLFRTSAGGDVLFAQFLASTPVPGTWRWTSSPAPGWNQISTEIPSQLTVSANGDCYGDYETLGLWRWSEVLQQLIQLSQYNPDQFRMTARR